MKVAKLQIKNFLTISEAEISPGSVNQIVGANNQGKTSILKALETGLCGSTDGSLVKKGETEAEIIVEFDDQTVVRRRLKSDGKQALVVKRGDLTAQQPQTFLDKFFGAGAFNPLELLDPKRRTEILLSAIPIKLTEADLAAAVGASPVGLPPVDYAQHGLKVAQQTHRYFYQRRAEANKDAKTKTETFRVKLAELPPLPDSTSSKPESEIRDHIAVLKQNIAIEQGKAAAQRERAKRIEADENDIKLNEAEIQTKERELAGLEARIVELKRAIDHYRSLNSVMRSKLESFKNEPESQGPDQAAIEGWNGQIQDCLEELQLRADRRALEQRHDQVGTLKLAATQAEKFASDLDVIVDKLAVFGSNLLTKAEMPIQGLSYEGDEFFLDGVKIENLSSSAAVRLAIAIARAVAGPSKLICLDGAEALDETTFAVLRREIQDDGFQYFLTKVGEAFAPESDDRVIKMHAGAPVCAEAAL
jgi:energy-coupling factor transporter ATP-binding protein EcfA2